MKQILRIFIVLLAAAAAVPVISCCTALPAFSQDGDEAARNFTPPSGKCFLYIIRAPETFDLATPIAVAVDGAELGTLKGGEYYLMTLDPGKHDIKAVIKGTFMDRSSATLTVSLKGDKNCFIEASSNEDKKNPEVRLSTIIMENKGKMTVRQSKLEKRFD